VYLDGRAISRNDLLDADALIVRTRTKCNGALLDGTPVKFIASATIGFDHIDTAFCDKRKIGWTNAAGCNSSSVQQYIAAALVHIANKLSLRLEGKTIGIVGVGNVGGKVERLCRMLGANVLLNDPPRERREGSGAFVSLDEILWQSDIVTLHVPLNREGVDKTFHLGDERFFSRLKPSQILFNTSRGEVLETQALRRCLKEKRIAACVLDVWENEPEIDRELLGLVDIGSPHIAGYSADGKANGTSMSVQAVSRFFGLNLNNWTPATVPEPLQPLIEIDCKGRARQEIFGKLVSHTYDILSDDRRLRQSPQTFEQQRGEYPLRREFPSFAVRLKNASDEITSFVKAFGFAIDSSIHT